MKNQSAPIPVPSPKEKKRWSFHRSTAAARRELINTAALSTSAPESEMEQKRHASAVSVATAAAADAAVAAAQAAAATTIGSSRANNAEEEDAATKIQSYFRSYQANKSPVHQNTEKPMVYVYRRWKGMQKITSKLLRWILVNQEAVRRARTATPSPTVKEWITGTLHTTPVAGQLQRLTFNKNTRHPPHQPILLQVQKPAVPILKISPLQQHEAANSTIQPCQYPIQPKLQ